MSFFSLHKLILFPRLPTCWGQTYILLYQAGFEIYNSLQGILSLPFFILSSCAGSVFLFMHAIPRNSFLTCLHPYHSWTHSHLLSPRGAAWPKWNEIFPLTPPTAGGLPSSGDGQTAALPGQPATSAVLVQRKQRRKEKWKVMNPRVRFLLENKCLKLTSPPDEFLSYFHSGCPG